MTICATKVIPPWKSQRRNNLGKTGGFLKLKSQHKSQHFWGEVATTYPLAEEFWVWVYSNENSEEPIWFLAVFSGIGG
jgi:hypothetical protein